MKEDLIVLSFSAKVENIRVARSCIRTFLNLKKIDEDEIFKIELALNEAIANIIEHTYKYDDTKYITMTVEFSENDLHIMLRDFGPKVDPSKIKSRPLDDIKEGGLGVYIIQSTMDEFRFDENVENGNLLHLRKKLKPH